MNTHLNNYEIKSYRKKNGNLSFHCKTVMLSDCGWNFDNEYIEKIKAYFITKDGRHIEFEISISCDSDFEYDGIFSTITLNLSAVSNISKIKEQTVQFVVEAVLDFPDGREEISHKQTGVLRHGY